MGSHSRLSPSSSARWLTCSASVAAIEQDIVDGLIIPDPPDYDGGIYAAWGTMAHEIGERLLLKQSIEMILEAVPDMANDPELLETAKDYQGYVNGLMREGSILYVEVRVPLDDWMPDAENNLGEMEKQGGTADTIILHLDNSMDVVDLKGGKGVFVDANGNSQARLYGLGALAEFELVMDIKVIRNHIVQPRMSNYSVEVLDVDELNEWGMNNVLPAVHDITHGTGVFAPSDKACQWCERKGYCKARSQGVLQEIVASIDDFEESTEIVKAESLTIEQMSLISSKAADITGLLKDVHNRLFDLMNAGQQVEGFKLVESNTKRQWIKNHDAIAQFMMEHNDDVKLEDVLIPSEPSMIGIGVAEKLMGKGFLDDFLVKPQGKLTIAPESDKRPSAKPVLSIADMDDLEDFDDLI